MLIKLEEFTSDVWENHNSEEMELPNYLNDHIDLLESLLGFQLEGIDMTVVAMEEVVTWTGTICYAFTLRCMILIQNNYNTSFPDHPIHFSQVIGPKEDIVNKWVDITQKYYGFENDVEMAKNVESVYVIKNDDERLNDTYRTVNKAIKKWRNGSLPSWDYIENIAYAGAANKGVSAGVELERITIEYGMLRILHKAL